jgi:hypothetical protein
LSPDIIKKTYKNTTQYARIPTGSLLKRTLKSPYPALTFVDIYSQLIDIYGDKTDKHIVNTLEYKIIDRGAPSKLTSDCAKVVIGDTLVHNLGTLCNES